MLVCTKLKRLYMGMSALTQKQETRNKVKDEQKFKM